MPNSDQTLRKALSYKRFRTTSRVLILDTHYYLIQDLVDGANLLGYSVATLPTKSHGSGSEEYVAELLSALVNYQPDYLLTINHRGFDESGILAQLLHTYEIPLASWFVDHPLPILGGSPGNVTASTQLFCLERTALPWLVELGFREPLHLPTATNPRYFHPDRIPQDRRGILGAPLCFVGQSWLGIAKTEQPAWAVEAANALQEAQPITRAYVAAGLLRDLPTVPMPLPADFATDAARLRARSRAAYVAMAQASMTERRSLAEAFAPLGMRICGDAGWSQVLSTMTPALLQQLDLRPQVDPTADLPAIYAGSAVMINQTSVSLPSALNLRLWDVPAAGGFVLTDYQSDLGEYFQEDEVVTYRDLGEAVDLARFYLGRPEARIAVTRRAQRRIEAHHQIQHRVRRIDQVMRARFASG